MTWSHTISRLAAAALLGAALQAQASPQASSKGHQHTVDCLRGSKSTPACQHMLRNYWQHEQAIAAVARHYGLEPALLKALVAVESRYNAQARSSADARGLGQVLPSTAREVGLHDPESNLYVPVLGLAAGAKYLRQMWMEFRDWSLALAAYNAGPGNVRKYKGIPPFPETQQYVPNVLQLYREFALADALAGQ